VNDDDRPLHKYRVRLRSAPGMWERYEGNVDVLARDDEQAVDRAIRELGRTSFPDRPSRSSWIVLDVGRAWGAA
jgi:hypothetical protein